MPDLTPNRGNALKSLNQQLNWYLNESDQAGREQPWLVADLVPNQIREFISQLRSGDARFSTTVDLEFAPITGTPWYADDPWFAESIDTLAVAWNQKSVAGLIGPRILHGSMGSGDYSLGWSDFDIFAVVPDATITEPAMMLELRATAGEVKKILQNSAPLQHHGVQWVTTDSLDMFDEASLPVAALRRGKTLGSSAEKISVRPRFDKQSSIRLLEYRIRLFEEAISLGELRHHAYEGTYLQSSYRNAGNGMYQLKYLLDVCTLAPAIAMAASGNPIDKGTAIAHLAGELTQNERALIEAATEVRTRWPRNEGINFRGNEIPGWIQNIVAPGYFEQALNLHAACLEFATKTEPNNRSK